MRHANWLIGPYAALRYVYLSEDGFAETGAGSVNLRVDGHSTEALSSELGLRVAHVIEAGNGRWVPEVRAAWNYDFGIGDNTISGAFAGVPGASFSLPETDSGGSGATIGAGVTYLQGNGFSTSLQFNGEFREGYSAYGVLGYIRYAF